MSRISLEGPVEIINGEMMLRIPLASGGSVLAALTRGIGTTDDEYLNIVIQPWLAEQLRIGPGSLVVVDNLEGKFRITRSEANDNDSERRPN